MLSGLWHGAAWNFILWGGFHGILLALQKMFSETYLKGRKITASYSTMLISLLVTQYFIFLGWIFFRLHDSQQIAYCIYHYLIPDFLLSTGQEMVLITGILGVCFLWLVLRTEKGVRIVRRVWDFDVISFLGTMPLRRWLGVCLGIGMLIIVFGPDAAPQFLYMRF